MKILRPMLALVCLVTASIASAAEPAKGTPKLPSRDPAIVVPLLQAFTSASKFQDVVGVLGQPELDIGSASPIGIFTLKDGSHIKVRTMMSQHIKDITLHAKRLLVEEGKGRILAAAK